MHPGSTAPVTTRMVVGVLGGGALVGLVFLLANSAVRAGAKDEALALDARVFHGFWRRAWHGQHLPRLPADLPAPEPSAYEWLGDEPFLAVAHALGPGLVDGPNSMRTLVAGLKMGFRVFEVDVALTIDDSLICYHGEGAGHRLDGLTYAAWVGIAREAGVEPLRFAELVEVARGHPDIRFVLDVKNRFDDAYRRAREEIGDSTLGHHFIPQIYFFEQLPAFRHSPFFGGVIFTSYLSALTTAQILATAQRSGIGVVTLTLPRFQQLRDVVPPGISLFTHAVDDPFTAWQVRRAGARGIYTSYLTPLTVPQLFSTTVLP